VRLANAWFGLAVVLSMGAVMGRTVLPAASDTERKTSRVASSHPLPRMDGGRLRVTVLEVIYGPGESSAPHTHPCPVVGYVAEGIIRTQVQGEPVAIYKAGESFYEAPDGVHLVSANASQRESAKLIAYFVCDHDKPLSVPVSEPGASGGGQS
jgi:quercetin dioxygenase-like cupin family protein